MIQGRHIAPEELAIYAMRLLSPEEAAAMAQHLDGCMECRHELQAITRDLALFAMTAEMHSPPAQTRQRLMKQVGRERRAVIPMERQRAPMPMQGMQSMQGMPVQSSPHYAMDADGRPLQQELPLHPPAFGVRNQGQRAVLSALDIDEEEPQRRNLFGMIMGWTGWAVAAGIGFFATNLYHQIDDMKVASAGQQDLIRRLHDDASKAHAVADMLTDSSAMRVTLTPTKATIPAMPIARVSYAAEKGMLILQASNMEPLQMYKTYELWLIPADGRDPMPAGIFHPDPQGNVSMVNPDVPKGVVAKEFGITVEDDGGSKVPTAPILMVGM